MKTFATTTIVSSLVILLAAFAADKTDAASSGNHINLETESALLAGDWRTVARLLDGVDEQSSSAVKRLIKGHACLALNRHDEAITLFVTTGDSGDLKTYHEWAADLVRRNEANGIAHYFAGDAYARLRKGNQARNALDRAIALDPSFALAYNARGVVRANNNDGDGAWDDFEAAIERNPRLLDAYENLGVLKFSESAFEGAKEAFQGAASISTEATLPAIGRACCLFPEGRWHDAEKQLNGCTNESVIGALATRNMYGAKTTQIRHDIEQLAALAGTNSVGSTLDFSEQTTVQDLSSQLYSDLLDTSGNGGDIGNVLHDFQNTYGQDVFSDVIPEVKLTMQQTAGVYSHLADSFNELGLHSENNKLSSENWQNWNEKASTVFNIGKTASELFGADVLGNIMGINKALADFGAEQNSINAPLWEKAYNTAQEGWETSMGKLHDINKTFQGIAQFENQAVENAYVQDQIDGLKSTYDLNNITLNPPGGVIAVVDVYKDAGAWNLVVPYGLAYPVADGGVTLAEEAN